MPEITSLTGVGGNEMFTRNDKGAGGVSQQDFLKLLITQLQHQDPMEPQDSQQFAAQLAQFSSLEELKNLNGTSTQGVETNLMLSQTINNTMAATMVGKEMTAIGNTFKLEGGGEAPSLSFELGDYADDVKVEIMDGAGTVVDTISPVGGMAKGQHTVEWDAYEDYANGDYSFKVNATNRAGDEIATDTLMVGVIEGVRYSNSGAIFIVNGREIPFSAVVEIGQAPMTWYDPNNPQVPVNPEDPIDPDPEDGNNGADDGSEV